MSRFSTSSFDQPEKYQLLQRYVVDGEPWCTVRVSVSKVWGWLQEQDRSHWCEVIDGHGYGKIRVNMHQELFLMMKLKFLL
jgi:hypothetical protein